MSNRPYTGGRLFSLRNLDAKVVYRWVPLRTPLGTFQRPLPAFNGFARKGYASFRNLEGFGEIWIVFNSAVNSRTTNAEVLG